MHIMSINRNIMECKVLCVIIGVDMDICINRNIMECKELRLNGFQFGFIVLIETLWNVKCLHNSQGLRDQKY